MNPYLSGLEVFPSSQILQQIPLLYKWVTDKSADPNSLKFVTTFVLCLFYLLSFHNLTHLAHDIPKPSFKRTF
jgi:hypothetical protein